MPSGRVRDEINSRARAIRDASEVPIGGSEEETKENVQRMFKSNDPDKRWKDLSEEDLAELDRMERENDEAKTASSGGS